MSTGRLIIGITGGIGSGKSAVSRYLAELGERVIDSDSVARKVVEPGEPGNVAIRRSFGGEYFKEDGTLDRKKIAALVFKDKEALDKLNSALHPLIAESMFEEARLFEGRVFMEVPLLIQSGMHESMDYIWLVVSDENKRIERVMQRDGLSIEEIMRRIENQMSDEEMTLYADEVIINNGSEKELYRGIDRLLIKPQYVR